VRSSWLASAKNLRVASWLASRSVMKSSMRDSIPFSATPRRPRSGAAATAIYAHGKGWATVIRTDAWVGGLAAALFIGALAGLLPAIRGARLSPTDDLWSL
jgi:ABC-type antimicrobial peptide transport system permease subunit